MRTAVECQLHINSTTFEENFVYLKAYLVSPNTPITRYTSPLVCVLRLAQKQQNTPRDHHHHQAFLSYCTITS